MSRTVPHTRGGCVLVQPWRRLIWGIGGSQGPWRAMELPAASGKPGQQGTAGPGLTASTATNGAFLRPQTAAGQNRGMAGARGAAVMPVIQKPQIGLPEQGACSGGCRIMDLEIMRRCSAFAAVRARRALKKERPCSKSARNRPCLCQLAGHIPFCCAALEVSRWSCSFLPLPRAISTPCPA